MGISAKSFTFNGTSSSSFDVVLVSFDTTSNTDTYKKDIIQDNITAYRHTTSVRGVKYSSPIQLSVDICKENSDWFTEQEYSDLVRWLSTSSPKLLSFSSCSNPNFNGVHFYAVCSSLTRFENYGNVAGLQLIFDTTAPYAYSDDDDIETQCTTSTTLTVNNTSDEEDDYYPVVTIKSLDNQDVSIVNSTDDNRSMTVTMVKDQTIIFNYDDGTCIDNTGIFKLDDFNLNWLRLIPGNNQLMVIGNCEVTIHCEFPRLVGGY